MNAYRLAAVGSGVMVASLSPCRAGRLDDRVPGSAEYVVARRPLVAGIPPPPTDAGVADTGVTTGGSDVRRPIALRGSVAGSTAPTEPPVLAGVAGTAAETPTPTAVVSAPVAALAASLGAVPIGASTVFDGSRGSDGVDDDTRTGVGIATSSTPAVTASEIAVALRRLYALTSA